MAQNSHEFHHFFPKLAEESGFTFNIHRPRVRVDWNKFRSIDIDSVIKDRKFYIIEQYLNDILHCVLESEFDVRILDEGFLKMFRLAQLAVEYQQFCRHYLDRSVFVLKEEVTSLAQELNATKKDLEEKNEEIKRLRRKSKHTYRSPLPYGNDNIAAMILKTLSHKSDLFGIPSTSNAGSIQYNKCHYCDKVFLNQLYLKSHLSRRHSNMLDIPEKDVTDNIQHIPHVKENPKLNEEIQELKAKLKDMENLLVKVNTERNTPIPSIISEAKPELSNNNPNVALVEKNNTRDAEVSTNTENNNLLNKIEEWKKEEHERHKTEITLLRAQFEDIVNSLKNKGSENCNANEPNFIEQLYTTIKQQGAEINALKEELSNARLSTEKDDTERKMEVETHTAFWVKRVEQQTKQYEALIQKLNVVAQEARDARTQAEAERARAAQLQVLLEENIKKRTFGEDHPKSQSSTREKLINGDAKKKIAKRKLKSEPDSKSFETLHRKAHELLNLSSLSLSENSSLSTETPTPQEVVLPKNQRTTKTIFEQKLSSQVKPVGNQNEDNGKNVTKVKIKQQTDEQGEQKETKRHKSKKGKVKAHANKPSYMGNGIIPTPGSPLKLVRAKITEEVNSRLVTIGVDPLKNRLPKSFYRKQKLQLQQQHEAKSKKNPEYQKVKHSLLAYLDLNTPTKKKNTKEVEDEVSPSKISKAFSLTSVISNVKNKALSLVKSNDTNNNSAKHKELNEEVAKKAISYLKTPPSSVSSSPVKRKIEAEIAVSEKDNRPRLQRNKTVNARTTVNSGTEAHIMSRKGINNKYNTSDDDSTESNHKYYNSAISQSTRSIVAQSTKSIENLIKSPARRPSSASAIINISSNKVIEKQDENLIRSQSAVNITEYKVETNHKQNTSRSSPKKAALSSDEIESLDESPIKKLTTEEHSTKQTKGVLKNASSTSSLNKKKVLFDMDAIQMKSVSASPSQSITEKSEHNEKFELGLINLDDGEEWDISSIENEPLKEDTKIQVNTRASPKIAELRQTIESQLARRNDTPSTTLVGGVNLLPTATRNSSIAGSNTSLGSSILDESDRIPKVQRMAFTISKKATEKEDSEIDLSDYSFNGTGYKKPNTNDSF